MQIYNYCPICYSLSGDNKSKERYRFYLKMHQKLFGGRVPPEPAGGAYTTLPHTP